MRGTFFVEMWVQIASAHHGVANVLPPEDLARTRPSADRREPPPGRQGAHQVLAGQCGARYCSHYLAIVGGFAGPSWLLFCERTTLWRPGDAGVAEDGELAARSLRGIASDLIKSSRAEDAALQLKVDAGVQVRIAMLEDNKPPGPGLAGIDQRQALGIMPDINAGMRDGSVTPYVEGIGELVPIIGDKAQPLAFSLAGLPDAIRRQANRGAIR